MKKVGTKKSDRRVDDGKGTVWASRFEHDTYHLLRDLGYRVRKCDGSDSVAYSTPVKRGRCLECSSDSVIQRRTYTPDLCVIVESPQAPFERTSIVECKGKFTPDKRELFRRAAAQWEGPPLFIVFQSNRLPRTKFSSIEWTHRYCKNVTPGLYRKRKGGDFIEWFPYER